VDTNWDPGRWTATRARLVSIIDDLRARSTFGQAAYLAGDRTSRF